jgi:hypothetical protein
VVVKITKNYVARHIKGEKVEPMLSVFPDIQRAHAEEILTAPTPEDAE